MMTCVVSMSTRVLGTTVIKTKGSILQRAMSKYLGDAVCEAHEDKHC